MSEHDVVVVGSGINGLVAAAELAGAGMDVALLERNERIGGFIASDELTLPGYVHDTFSSWHPLFVTGGAGAALRADLERHGMRYCESPDAVTASVDREGTKVVCYRDPARTAGALADEGDRAAYLQMIDDLVADIDVVGAALGSELRGSGLAGLGAQVVRKKGRGGAEALVHQVATSGRAWMRGRFTGREVDQLWAPWLLHAGLAPDSAVGGLMIPLFALTMHGAGLPVVEGGQRNFVAAFEGLLAERGVTVVTGAQVDRIHPHDGSVAEVRAGERSWRARRAVLASVSPGALYGELLTAAHVPAGVREEAARYRPGRRAMQIHLALDGPVPWRDEELAGVPLVHLTDGSGGVGVACAQAEAGLLPARPTVVVGQQHVLDPSRVPEGKALLWLQLQEVPGELRGDAGGELDVTGGWSESVVDGYVDRVLGLLEEQAPGVRDLVVGRHVLTPADLEAYNPNAIGGDPYGGSAELDQFLLWRPGPHTSRHRTSAAGVWHIGAATHPGPGLGGGSGHLVAQALISGTDTAAGQVRHGAQRVAGTLRGTLDRLRQSQR